MSLNNILTFGSLLAGQRSLCNLTACARSFRQRTLSRSPPSGIIRFTSSSSFVEPSLVSSAQFEKNEEDAAKYARQITEAVNKLIENQSKERLFAAIQLYSKQYLVTVGDLIQVRHHFAASPGDQIKIEKVFMVGGKDMTLIGRPTLDRDQVRVTATIVEKSMTHTYNFVHHIKRRWGSRHWMFYRYPTVLMRINTIQISHPLNVSQDEVQ